MVNAPDVPVTQVGQVNAPVVALKISGEDAFTANVPEVFGNRRVGVPAALCGDNSTCPLLTPEKDNVPAVVPGTPKTGVAVGPGTPIDVVVFPQTWPPRNCPVQTAKAGDVASNAPINEIIRRSFIVTGTKRFVPGSG